MSGRSRVAVVLAGLLSVTACGGASGSPPSGPPACVHCPIGSNRLHSAVTSTLSGLDPGVFSSFRVAAPPPLQTAHYSGPLWTYATVAGSASP